MSARKTVGFTIIATAGIVTVAKVSNGEAPEPRTYISLAALWFFLALLADTMEDVAGPLAMLIFTVVLLSYGSEWLDNLTRQFRR